MILLLLLVSTLASAQKSEKIKGSKTVTIESKTIDNFEAIEVSDNIEVYLDRGEKCELKIEADDNLHDVIAIDVTAKTLRINTTKEITNFKKIIVRVTYTKELKKLTAKNNTTINAIQEIQLNEIAFESFDKAKLFLNVNSKNFNLKSEDNSKIELNLKSENATIQLSKNAALKALITSADLKCDLYQKAKASIEGDVSNSTIRLDNNSVLTADKLIIKNAQLTTESYSDCSINVSENLILDASGNSEIRLYGDQKIEMKRFVDNTSLSKKPTK